MSHITSRKIYAKSLLWQLFSIIMAVIDKKSVCYMICSMFSPDFNIAKKSYLRYAVSDKARLKNSGKTQNL